MSRKPSSGRKTGRVVNFFKEGDDLSEAFRPTETKMKFAQEILKAPVGTEIRTWVFEKDDKRILKITEREGHKYLSFVNGKVPHYLSSELWLNSSSFQKLSLSQAGRLIADYLQYYGQIIYPKKGK